MSCAMHRGTGQRAQRVHAQRDAAVSMQLPLECERRRWQVRRCSSGPRCQLQRRFDPVCMSITVLIFNNRGADCLRDAYWTCICECAYIFRFCKMYAHRPVHLQSVSSGRFCTYDCSAALGLRVDASGDSSGCSLGNVPGRHHSATNDHLRSSVPIAFLRQPSELLPVLWCRVRLLHSVTLGARAAN
jgi:hypothetical protein